MISRLARRMLTAFRDLDGWLRRLTVILCYPEVELGRGATIGRGAMVKATDGGRIHIGARVAISPGAVLVAKGGLLSIGSDGFVGEGAVIVCRREIEIGADALIAEYVTIRDQDHGSADIARPMRLQDFTTAPVAIGSDVWLGAKATVLKGVVIGDGTIVGAGAVVARSLPPGVIAVGAPCRVLRPRQGA